WNPQRRSSLIGLDLTPAAAAAAARTAAAQQSSPFLVNIGNERFLSLPIPVAADWSQPLYALVQGSYDKALVPLHALQWRILIIGLVALSAALLVGIVLAGGVIQPVKTLVSAMRAVLGGNLQQHAQVDRGDEIGFLARSFNEMVDGLRDREHIKNTFGRFVSRDVAEAVLAGRVPLGGERLEVSILFQDIR